jgi:phosphoribosylformimino-5-aminoimidazole carboxamide ribotide isomerase
VRRHFRVIPVLDLKDGQAVHAVAGRREQYRAIRSVWQASSEPIALARSLRDALGLDTLYLADLDAIAGGSPALAVYGQLAGLGLELWIDAGLRDAGSATPLLALDGRPPRIVVGLETVRGPAELAAIVARAGLNRAVFSLDLFDGRPLIGAAEAWMTDDPLELAHWSIEVGLHRLIVLDLARVGTGRGIGTDRLIAGIRAAHPEVEITAGGGIARVEGVLDLWRAGASGVLVGSAIHDGRIGRRELEQIDRAVQSA